MSALLLAGLLLLGQDQHAQQSAGWCQQFRLTGYVRTEFSPRTADGTSIYTDEPIVAASWNVPLGWYADIDGLGLHRVADRGMLGSSGWLDVAVWDRATAFAITGHRWACVYPPEDIPS